MFEFRVIKDTIDRGFEVRIRKEKMQERYYFSIHKGSVSYDFIILFKDLNAAPFPNLLVRKALDAAENDIVNQIKHLTIRGHH